MALKLSTWKNKGSMQCNCSYQQTVLIGDNIFKWYHFVE